MLSSLFSVRWARLLLAELKQSYRQAEAWIVAALCKCSSTPSPCLGLTRAVECWTLSHCLIARCLQMSTLLP